ncbi:MAG: hypothetical protein WDM70_02690 [Nitrosomonadales bacterium]
MKLQEAFPQTGIEGDLDGAGNYSLSGATLTQLNLTPLLDGTFKVKSGMISKMDMVETAANRQMCRVGVPILMT